jgi:hypothetical protein
MADIRDKTKTLAEIRDNWASTGIEGALHGRCAFTDIDALTERNGQFLIIERNRSCRPMSKGQEITFNAIASQPNWSVVEVWGEPDHYPRIRIIRPWHPEGDKIHDLSDKTQDEQIAAMTKLVRQWTTLANNQPPRSSNE